MKRLLINLSYFILMLSFYAVAILLVAYIELMKLILGYHSGVSPYDWLIKIDSFVYELVEKFIMQR